MSLAHPSIPAWNSPSFFPRVLWAEKQEQLRDWCLLILLRKCSGEEDQGIVQQMDSQFWGD